MPESLERYPGMIGTKVRFECEITPGIFNMPIKTVSLSNALLVDMQTMMSVLDTASSALPH